MAVIVAMVIEGVMRDGTLVAGRVSVVWAGRHRPVEPPLAILADDRRRVEPLDSACVAASNDPGVDPGLIASLRGLDQNGRLLFAMRTLRMFGYGFLAVVLVLYLAAAGLDPLAIGIC